MVEKKYTKIPNVVLEELIKMKLKVYEYRIILAISRKTHGWNKPDDWISNSQLVTLTGIKKQHVSRTISELKQQKIVTSSGNKIALNENVSEWKKLPCQVTVPSTGNNVTPPGNGVTPLGQKVTPSGEHKEHYTNGTGTKDIFSAKNIISLYCDLYKDKYGMNPHITKKYSGTAKGLTKHPDIKELLIKFFNSNDKFVIQERHGLHIIESQINKLRATEDQKSATTPSKYDGIGQSFDVG